MHTNAHKQKRIKSKARESYQAMQGKAKGNKPSRDSAKRDYF